MLVEFFTWWRQQLLELVPEALRRGAGADSNALVVEASGNGLLTISRRRRGVEGKLAQARLDEPGLLALRSQLEGRPRGEPVVLRLPPAMVLERPVTLPLAAERETERVLGYEMERLTPFTADEVYWGSTVEARDKTHGRLLLRLTFVLRTQVQDLLDALAHCGGAASLMEGATDQGPRTIRLAHNATNDGPTWLSPRVASALLAGGLALVLLSPFVRQSLDLAEAESALDNLQPRMHVVDQLRQRIAGAGAGGDVVAAETKRLGDALEALAAVTDILKNDSYLTEYAMRERKITLSGLSSSAPKLISALSSDERVKNPAFTAPVTRQEAGHLDVFAIRADLAQ